MLCKKKNLTVGVDQPWKGKADLLAENLTQNIHHYFYEIYHIEVFWFQIQDGVAMSGKRTKSEISFSFGILKGNSST